MFGNTFRYRPEKNYQGGLKNRIPRSEILEFISVENNERTASALHDQSIKPFYSLQIGTT